VGEDAALGGLLDEGGIARVDQHDHGTGGFAHDLVDQFERVVGALAESDQGDVGPLAGGYGTNVFDVDLAHDYLVPQVRDDRR